MASTLVPLLREPDRPALDALLAPAVQFHSPFADYAGHDDVSHLISTIATVVHDVEPTRVLEDDGGRTTFIDGRVDDRALQGVLDERYDDAGQLVEATLFIRPYATLRVAMAHMGAALEADPLPSKR